jgi:hypothetical protein
MGWLGSVLLLPLAPLQGMVWLARLLEEIAEKELTDPEVLRSRLREAEEAHRRGEISNEELEQIEEVVFGQLMAVQETRGGVS